MTSHVRIFGMHKAGTSFLMKALSHFCHRNQVALASIPFAMVPMSAYEKWEGGMDRKALNDFLLSIDPKMLERIQAFSENDFSSLDILSDRIKKADIFSIGDNSSEKRVVFYRNSNVHVWQQDTNSPAIRVIRNPLSIVKSAYFSHKKTHSTIGWSRLEKQRGILNSISRDEGMRKTYDFLRDDLFFHMTEGPLRTLSSWPEDNLGALQTVRMEDMTTAPSSFLLRLWRMLGGQMEDLRFVPPEILTFEHQSGGRKPGEVDANDHMRSGDPEEWRELLPKDLIKRIQTDYREILETYYPSALSDGNTRGIVALPPKATLQELEGLYTTLMENRKESETLKTAVSNVEGRLETVLEQRNKAASSLTARFDDMKSQRDKALKEIKTAQDQLAMTAKLQPDTKALDALRKERDAALHEVATLKEAPKVVSPEIMAKLKAVTEERDAAQERYNTMVTLKDEAVGAYKTMMQFRDDALLSATSKSAQQLSELESNLKNMMAQRDTALTESKGKVSSEAYGKLEAQLNDMKDQRDKALKSQEAIKASRDASLKEATARFEDMKAQRDKSLKDGKGSGEAYGKLEAQLKDMKAQRDKALAESKGKVSGEAYSKLEAQLNDMKDQRDKALKAQEAMKASRDASLKEATARFEDMKAQRDKALKDGKGSGEAYGKLEAQLKDMKAQRDKALGESKGKVSGEAYGKLEAQLNDMKDQRDKALKAQEAMKASRDASLKEATARFEDMKAQRDKALGESKGKASGEAYGKLEAQLNDMKDQRNKALKAQEAMKASRDASLKEATARFEDMKAQRDKALAAKQNVKPPQAQAATPEAIKSLEKQLIDMTAQRDAALKDLENDGAGAAKSVVQAKLQSQYDDMIVQRDRHRRAHQEMKAERDALLKEKNARANE